MAEWVLWASLGLCMWTYGGYLAFLVFADALGSLRSNARWLASAKERRHEADERLYPKVSVLVAAWNEEDCIREKIENTLALEWPAERLEVLVGSDGSTDGTDAIVSEYADRGVRLSTAPRAGKASVLNRLAREATGELFLLTDANTMLAPDALRQLVRPLADPMVGGVSGRLRLVDAAGRPTGEGVYWRYENLLKFYESRFGALTGANGGLYLLRRSEWRGLPPDTIVDDFVATMRVVVAGRKLVYAPDALATEETAPDPAGEFRRRVRIAAGNFQSLRELRPMLLRPTFATFALWSHKLVRWSVPALLALALVTNALLVSRPPYAVLFALQVLFYAAALTMPGRLPGVFGKGAMLARYFVEMNAALALGFVRHLRGSQRPTWQRTARIAGGAG